MPELPEVETVRKGLNLHLSKLPVEDRKLVRLKRSDKKLRFDFPGDLLQKLKGLNLLGVTRRAKYLLFDFGDKILINHLGMTGSWRSAKQLTLGLHDHVGLEIDGSLKLIFRDPRRFGYFDLLDKKDWEQSLWFHHLGPEPLDPSVFTAEYLFEKTRGKTAPIKNLIMDQKIVVGVGNIYASEALFMAGIRPQRAAKSLKRLESKKLVEAIRKVLKKSIEKGGSTIRDFVAADGEAGYFVQSLKVYDRKGEPCRGCKKKILHATLAGRSTYWCSQCQK